MNILLSLKKDLMQVMLKLTANVVLRLWERKKGKKIFAKQNDRILIYLKKCTYFVEKSTPEIRDQIFSLSKDNEKQGKRPCKLILIDFCIIFLVYFY